MKRLLILFICLWGSSAAASILPHDAVSLEGFAGGIDRLDPSDAIKVAARSLGAIVFGERMMGLRIWANNLFEKRT